MDNFITTIRSVLSGSVTGSVKFLVVLILALSVWTGSLLVSDEAARNTNTLSSQQARFNTLLTLASEYKTLAPASASAQSNVDVASVFASVSERMELGSRVNRITPDGRNQAVEINRLYVEEFAQLQRQLSSRGVRFLAAEMRALPSGSERLMTISAIIGPMN